MNLDQLGNRIGSNRTNISLLGTQNVTTDKSIMFGDKIQTAPAANAEQQSVKKSQQQKHVRLTAISREISNSRRDN